MAQEGPEHAPVFIMAAEVNGHIYIASGANKKEAKHAVAERALRAFVQHRDAFEVNRMLSRKRSAAEVDFTSDDALVADEEQSAAGEFFVEGFEQESQLEIAYSKFTFSLFCFVYCSQLIRTVA